MGEMLQISTSYAYNFIPRQLFLYYDHCGMEFSALG